MEATEAVVRVGGSRQTGHSVGQHILANHLAPIYCPSCSPPSLPLPFLYYFPSFSPSFSSPYPFPISLSYPISL